MRDVRHLETPEEVLRYWQELLQHEPEGMPYNDPEHIAGKMLGALIDNEHYIVEDDSIEDWQDKYPDMMEVFEGILQLDQKETFTGVDHAYDWQEVKKHVAALEAVLKKEKGGSGSDTAASGQPN